jgi:hypothetical protein
VTDIEEFGALHLKWADTDDQGFSYVNDLVGSAEQAGDDAHEPVDTLALACTAAFASTALGKALDHEWALYTPQDAAVVASAIQAQVATTADNLRKLIRAVEHIAERGEVELPEVSGLDGPEEETLSDALDQISEVAGQLGEVVTAMHPLVPSLHRAASKFRPSPNLHSNLRAVVALLGEGAEMNEHQHDEDHEESGCTAVITRGSETYYFGYMDSEWTLLRDGDAEHHSDGSKFWINGGSVTIEAGEELAHPHQLAQEVRQAIGDPEPS